MFFKKQEKEKTTKEILKSFSSLEKKVDDLSSLVQELKKENEKMVQKIGLIRFNPFSNIGGDQSFSLAILNGKNDGVVVTSFYSSEGSSVYGKLIKKGESLHVLSKEEKIAIEKAINNDNGFLINEVDKKDKEKKSTKKNIKIKVKKN